MALLFPATPQFGDNDLDPVGAGDLYIYDNETTDLATIYSDPGLTTTKTNPVTLDSAGRIDNIFVAEAKKFTVTLKDSAGSQVWSRDNIVGIPTGQASVLDYGCPTDGTSDCYAAIQAAHDGLPAGSTLHIPSGTYLVGTTLLFSRLDIDYRLEGTIKPYGSFSDYLGRHRLDTATEGRSAGNGLMNTNIYGPRLDCNRQSRGWSFEYLDNAVVNGFHVEKFYGSGMRIWSCREMSFMTPILQEGRERANPDVSGAGAWSSGTTYNVDDVVYRDADTWASGSYSAGDYVKGSDGNHYQCIRAATTEDPTDDVNGFDYWVRVAVEYYKALLGSNLNQDPLTENNLNATAGNRYWMQIFAEEPAIDANETDVALGDANNGIHMFNTIFHECSHTVFMRIDSNKPIVSKPRNFNFWGGWFHYMTQQYLDQYATANSTGQSLNDNLRLLEIGIGHRIYLNGTIFRLAWYTGSSNVGAYDSRGLAAGMRNTLKVVDRINLNAVELSGEGERQTGIHFQNSGVQATSHAVNNIQDAMAGSYSQPFSDHENKTKPQNFGHQQFEGYSDWTASFIDHRNAGVGLWQTRLFADTYARMAAYAAYFAFGPGNANLDTILGRSAEGLLYANKPSAFATGYVQATQEATTAQIEDVSHEINTVGKFAGRMIRNDTTGVMVFADGPAAPDPWATSAGVTTHSPV